MRKHKQKKKCGEQSGYNPRYSLGEKLIPNTQYTITRILIGNGRRLTGGMTGREVYPVDVWSTENDLMDELFARESINRLPEKQARAVYLRVYRDMWFAEVGKVLGVSRQRAKQLYESGLEQLRGVK